MNLTHALGWTLLHFLWQGALIALLLAGGLVFLRRAGSGVRYAASCAAMILMLACATATFLGLEFTGTRSHHYAPALINLAPLTGPAATGGVLSGGPLADYLPALVWAWFGGVIALSIRSLGGWAVAERFARRHTWPAEAVWDERFAALVKRLRISRPVRLAVSALAQVPAVVGWMRPIVLVPASVFVGLTVEQIEALLAHELAHVRRHDYLVNLLQTATETLLFYHPAVWWVTRIIRNERENCCDDLAIETCGNTVAYVQALTELEQMRHVTPRLAMAANGGSLLGRAQRLLGMNQTAGTAAAGWLAVIGIAACLLVAGIAANGLAQRTEKAAAASPRPAPAIILAQQTGAPPQALRSPSPSPAAPKKPEEKKDSGGWLDAIQAEGYRDLNVDQLIALKIHGVDGEYIRQIRAAGLRLTVDQLVAFRIHGVTADFIDGLKQVGLRDLKADDLVALRIHGAEPDWIRQIQSLGYPNLSVDNVVALRIHGVTPAFIVDARNHGLNNLSLDQLIRLKQLGILKTPEII
jgi:beta-lactamase regulating signal transducer with metallopeptidase domain